MRVIQKIGNNEREIWQCPIFHVTGELRERHQVQLLTAAVHYVRKK